MWFSAMWCFKMRGCHHFEFMLGQLVMGQSSLVWQICFTQVAKISNDKCHMFQVLLRICDTNTGTISTGIRYLMLIIPSILHLADEIHHLGKMVEPSHWTHNLSTLIYMNYSSLESCPHLFRINAQHISESRRSCGSRYESYECGIISHPHGIKTWTITSLVI